MTLAAQQQRARGRLRRPGHWQLLRNASSKPRKHSRDKLHSISFKAGVVASESTESVSLALGSPWLRRVLSLTARREIIPKME